ncbi:MAG: UDP-N-acetylmuramoyl-L-alanine--D-glutamate ligase [Treponema sp.]|nr:UDP-N-acetylmuramoyl-L-alanine--D-glutamate ligase [Treponema sp.]
MEFHSYSSTCAFKSIEDIKNKHVTIMGLGLNGGGEAAVRFFLKKGAYVTVTDMKTPEQLKPTVDKINNDPELDTSKLTYRLGEHKMEDFENADCVIKNPGVKYEDNKYLAAAKAIETDLSIFLRFTTAPIIAVTGSKGKSSTVSSIYYGLKTAGYKTFLGGNITVSPLTFFDEVTQDTPVVIEFSSWQLADLRGRKVLKPYISIITKIVPDHQNWYGNMEDYVADKRLIYADQDEGCYSIFDDGEDEPGTGPKCGGTWGDLFASETKATVLRYGKTELRKGFGAWQTKDDKGNFCGKILLPRMEKPETILSSLSVPGDHMKVNVLNAAMVMYLMGIPAKKTEEICGKWQGIDHRLQYFHSWKNSNGTTYKFYNDSCATVPEAASAATKAFNKPVILLTGGTDKGLELDILEETLKTSPVKDLYFLAGTATDKILPGLNKASVKYHGPFNNLEALFAELKENISKESEKEDQIVVFSPGATSFGMFTNEFDRGNKFMAGIKNLF